MRVWETAVHMYQFSLVVKKNKFTFLRESEEALELNINNKLEMALASFQTVLLLANHGLNEVMRTWLVSFQGQVAVMCR